jgi:asparagine synthase (glutamine-hydrolysing)
MCGIFGCLNLGAAPLALLKRMAEAQRHRGPDHTGFHTEPETGLGTVRLSILDLSAGDQPIYSPDKRQAIVFNGQIYNHRELRRELPDYPFRTASDTETLLAAFLRWGPECLPRLNGMFAFAVWDSQEKTLFLARDRFGVKPLYFMRKGEAFCFSSEVKGLLPVMDAPRPDMSALGVYLQLGYVPSPLCAFEGVEKFPPGHFALWRDGEPRFTRWHQSAYGERRTPRRQLLPELDFLLERAVHKEMLSDVPIGVLLSGGLDSSLVAAYAARRAPEMESFALGFTEATHDEARDAQLAASHIGLRRHQTLRLHEGDLRALFTEIADNIDEPFADPTVLPLLAIARFARRKVKVVLTGWGGDEMFMGYPTLQAHRLASFYRWLPGPLSRRLIPAIVAGLPVSDKYLSLEFKARRFLSGVWLPPERRHLAWMGYFDQAEAAALLSAPGPDPDAFFRQILDELRAPDTLSRILELDARLFMEGNGLFQADRMSMLASLEARVPLLNPDVAEWANGLAWPRKMPHGRLKSLLKDLGKKYLPPRLLRKPKKGFGPPTSQWLRGPLKKAAEAVLAPERLEGHGLLRPGPVRALWAEHQERRADNGRKLWCLISLQLWRERYFGRTP